jgi:type II secretory pathway pseudopilin PulG
MKFSFSARRQAGFTLTELLLYMGLLIILITILSQVFVSILDVQLESKSTSSVELDGKYIITKLIHDMQSMQTNPPVSDSIVTPSTPGEITNTLNFKVNSINYIYSLNSGNLELNSNNLNSVDTTVSALQFTRIGAGTNKDTIRVNFTLTSKTKRNSGPETRNYQTTISSQ